MYQFSDVLHAFVEDGAEDFHLFFDSRILLRIGYEDQDSLVLGEERIAGDRAS